MHVCVLYAIIINNVKTKLPGIGLKLSHYGCASIQNSTSIFTEKVLKK